MKTNYIHVLHIERLQLSKELLKEEGTNPDEILKFESRPILDFSDELLDFVAS